jgi:hypothetical protein
VTMRTALAAVIAFAATPPIKGNLTPTDQRELCICHVRGAGFYDKTKRERCYATDEDARRAGAGGPRDESGSVAA